MGEGGTLVPGVPRADLSIYLLLLGLPPTCGISITWKMRLALIEV